MLLSLLVRYLRPHKLLLLLLVFFQLLQAFAALTLPAINADLIDDGVVTGDIPVIFQLGGVMLLLTLLQVAAAITAVYLGSRIASDVGRQLRADIFAQVLRFSEQEVAQFGAPSLIVRNTNDVQQVQQLVQMSATMMLSAPMLAIGGIIMAIRQDGTLSWLLVVSIPLLLAVVFLVVRYMVPAFRKLQRQIDRINEILREQITGIRVIRAFVRERQETERFAQGSKDVRDTSIWAGNLMAILMPSVMFIMNASGVAVIWFGAMRVQDGSIEIGTLFAFLNYIMQILIGVMMATFMVVMIPRAAVSADRMADVLDTTISVQPPTQPQQPAQTDGSLALENVSFSYPGAPEPVLQNLTAAMAPGTTTAIIGSTGSGKSTFIYLFPRLFDATEGTVRVNGQDVRDYDQPQLWSQLAIVPQRAFLFAGTVASNLRFGQPDATDEQLWHALETAQAAEFVRQMPEGLHSPIAQGGTNVSGGQRQRLSIARALLKRAPILIFDDAFSALDVSTDSQLRAALTREFPHTTQIVVAQRVSTIRHADQILILDRGRIVGRGTHDECLESCQEYREIVESQHAVEEVL